MIGPGRPNELSRVRVLGTRPMVPADLLGLREGARPKGLSARVKTFRDSHHMVARLFACGLRIGQVVAISGYSYQRVWTLSVDPSFQDLIAKYRADKDLMEANLGPLDALNAMTVITALKAARHQSDYYDDLDAAGEIAPPRTSLATFAECADRIGFGKRSTQVNVNVDFAARLESAIRRSKTVEHEPAPPLRRIA